MNMDAMLNSLPRKTVTMTSVCIGTILIFILAGIIPLQISIARTEKEIKRLSIRIAEQKVLAPIHKTFQDIIRKGEAKRVSELSDPKPQKLPKSQMQNLSRIMRDVASRAGMNTVLVSPDINTTDIANSVSVHHIIQGNYTGFRRYLLYLGQLPYYENVDSIKIEETASGLEFSVRLKVTVA